MQYMYLTQLYPYELSIAYKINKAMTQVDT